MPLLFPSPKRRICHGQTSVRPSQLSSKITQLAFRTSPRTRLPYAAHQNPSTLHRPPRTALPSRLPCTGHPPASQPVYPGPPTKTRLPCTAHHRPPTRLPWTAHPKPSTLDRPPPPTDPSTLGRPPPPTDPSTLGRPPTRLPWAAHRPVYPGPTSQPDHQDPSTLDRPPPPTDPSTLDRPPKAVYPVPPLPPTDLLPTRLPCTSHPPTSSQPVYPGPTTHRPPRTRLPWTALRSERPSPSRAVYPGPPSARPSPPLPSRLPWTASPAGTQRRHGIRPPSIPSSSTPHLSFPVHLSSPRKARRQCAGGLSLGNLGEEGLTLSRS